MLIIEDLERFQAEWDFCVLTLGVFDGLHRGHQSLLKQVHKQGKKKGYARVLLSYHPHPDFVLGKREAQAGTELFDYQEKISLFRKCPLDAVCLLPFTPQTARITAVRYLQEFLLDRLHAAHIVIGYDQHFGKDRKGNYAFLKKMSQSSSFHVKRIRAVKYRGEIISSSNIRKYILSGNVEKANFLLGYDFFIQAKVQHGEKRGRTLGFPTANLKVSPTKAIPQEGVYAGWAFLDKEKHRAMISIGNNPSFYGSDKILENRVEAHLLHFKGDLYGKTIQISFQKRIRDQMKFASPQELAEQIKKDRLITAKL